MKTLFLSPLQPQNAGGGGGEGGYPGFVSLQVPTSEAAVSADTHAFARLPPGGLRKNRSLRGLVVFVGKRPQAPGGPGPKPWGPGPQAPGDLATGPWGLDTRVRWARASKRYHNPQSADLGGPWMVSEGGAVQFHERRGSVFAPAFQPLGRAPSP